MKQLAIIVAVLLSFPAAAKFYKYRDLQVTEEDDLMKVVNSQIRKARAAGSQNQDEADQEGDHKDSEATEYLREAMRYALSRPNRSDKLLDVMFMPVRRELLEFHAFEDTLVGLVDEALTGYKNDKIPVIYRATFIFVLENSLSEMRPELESKPEFKRATEKIRDAKIKIEGDVKKELLMTSMYQIPSPSDTAKRILESPRKSAPATTSDTPPTPVPIPASSGKPKHKIEIH